MFVRKQLLCNLKLSWKKIFISINANWNCRENLVYYMLRWSKQLGWIIIWYIWLIDRYRDRDSIKWFFRYMYLPGVLVSLTIANKLFDLLLSPNTYIFYSDKYFSIDSPDDQMVSDRVLKSKNAAMDILNKNVIRY